MLCSKLKSKLTFENFTSRDYRIEFDFLHTIIVFEDCWWCRWRQLWISIRKDYEVDLNLLIQSLPVGIVGGVDADSFGILYEKTIEMTYNYCIQ